MFMIIKCKRITLKKKMTMKGTDVKRQLYLLLSLALY